MTSPIIRIQTERVTEPPLVQPDKYLVASNRSDMTWLRNHIQWAIHNGFQVTITPRG